MAEVVAESASGAAGAASTRICTSGDAKQIAGRLSLVQALH